MALLAPMPSARVSAATKVKAGAARIWRSANAHVVREFLDPLHHTHLPIPPASEIDAGALETGDITEPRQGLAAGFRRVEAGVDELAGPHLEVEGEFVVDLLVDGHPPEPRAQRPFHDANSTFDTPIEKRFQVASSAASWARPGGVSR